MTFGEWRRQRRLLAAVEWLTSGRPVTQIALDLGYDSPSAFIAMFKRHMRTTPSRFAAVASYEAMAENDSVFNSTN